jgi:site-specific recombinase XerD
MVKELTMFFQENLDYLIQRYLEEMEEKKSVGQTAKMTVRGYKTCFKWFELYISNLPNAETLSINDLDIDFFVRYERFLLSQGTLSKNYINKLMRIVKVFFNYIYFNGWSSKKVDFRISTKYINPHRPIISFETINQLMTIKLDTDKLNETRDLFLFQIFCGTAYVDLKNLTSESVKIIEGRMWLILNRRKTGTEQKIVMLPQAAEIIEKYKNHHYCLKHNQLLPIKSNCNSIFCVIKFWSLNLYKNLSW